MKAIEYKNVVDKSTWGAGPWQDEPDKAQWQDKETGFPCLIVRGPAGALCGYVGVASKHLLYGRDYSDGDDPKEGQPCTLAMFSLSVHGGLTFTGRCHEVPPVGDSICHLVEEGEVDDVWWLGFDTAHSGDFLPKFKSESLEFKDLPSRFSPWGEPDQYKDWIYVGAEVQELAKQLKLIGDKGS